MAICTGGKSTNNFNIEIVTSAIVHTFHGSHVLSMPGTMLMYPNKSYNSVGIKSYPKEMPITFKELIDNLNKTIQLN